MRSLVQRITAKPELQFHFNADSTFTVMIQIKRQAHLRSGPIPVIEGGLEQSLELLQQLELEESEFPVDFSDCGHSPDEPVMESAGSTSLSAEDRFSLNQYLRLRSEYNERCHLAVERQQLAKLELRDRIRRLVGFMSSSQAVNEALRRPVPLTSSKPHDPQFFVLFQRAVWAGKRQLSVDEWEAVISDTLEREAGTIRAARRPGLEPDNRERISAETRRAVWLRDQGRCARCGSRERLEYDHIIPVSLGGGNTERNIELLCERCNRQKSNAIL
jgi:hypothetical protein